MKRERERDQIELKCTKLKIELEQAHAQLAWERASAEAHRQATAEAKAQIESLEDNEISPVIKDGDRVNPIKFKIVTVTNRINEHEANFAQDYLKIKDLALQEKQLNAVSKWQEEKIMDTYIKINGELRSCDFNSNWFKIK